MIKLKRLCSIGMLLLATVCVSATATNTVTVKNSSQAYTYYFHLNGKVSGSVAAGDSSSFDVGTTDLDQANIKITSSDDATCLGPISYDTLVYQKTTSLDCFPSGILDLSCSCSGD